MAPCYSLHYCSHHDSKWFSVCVNDPSNTRASQSLTSFPSVVSSSTVPQPWHTLSQTLSIPFTDHFHHLGWNIPFSDHTSCHSFYISTPTILPAHQDHWSYHLSTNSHFPYALAWLFSGLNCVVIIDNYCFANPLRSLAPLSIYYTCLAKSQPLLNPNSTHSTLHPGSGIYANCSHKKNHASPQWSFQCYAEFLLHFLSPFTLLNDYFTLSSQTSNIHSFLTLNWWPSFLFQEEKYNLSGENRHMLLSPHGTTCQHAHSFS